MRCSLRKARGRAVLNRLESESEFEGSITPVVGELLYSFAVARRPALAIEFGALVGYPTLYLAAALSDVGSGSLVTTELAEEDVS